MHKELLHQEVRKRKSALFRLLGRAAKKFPVWPLPASLDVSPPLPVTPAAICCNVLDKDYSLSGFGHASNLYPKWNCTHSSTTDSSVASSSKPFPALLFTTPPLQAELITLHLCYYRPWFINSLLVSVIVSLSPHLHSESLKARNTELGIKSTSLENSENSDCTRPKTGLKM